MEKMLTEKDFDYAYSLLREEISDFDCGKVCSKKNPDGIPYCCDNATAIPVLYHEEYEYLKKRTDLWRHHKPRKSEKLDDLEYQIYAKCLGAEKCDRRYRAIVCRNFPTYPWFDEKGIVTALFFNRAIKGKCYLVDRPALIRKQFIINNIRFWNFILPKIPGEWQFYRQFAKKIDRLMIMNRLNFVLLKP